MTPICLYFQLHQPYRLRPFSFFDDRGTGYFDDPVNREILARVAEKCYRPATAMLEKLACAPGCSFGVSLSISGVLLEQLTATEPDVIEGFRRLVRAGRTEILAETSHHSLAWLISSNEFLAQLSLHRRLVQDLFGVTPRVFRNTELLYNDELARFIEGLGYEAILADGVPALLEGRSPDFLYRPAGTRQILLFLRNDRLSDDIAFRFSDRTWADWPLTPAKYVGWLKASSGRAEVLNLFMDLETFGEHQWKDSGIFEFFERLAQAVEREGGRFLTVSEAAARLSPRGALSSPGLVSWADTERDVSAWQGNELQRDALRAIAAIETPVKAAGSAALLEDWRRLTTSDHFYYMSTKRFSDGEVHEYFSPYESPYEAYMRFMHVVADLARRVRKASPAGLSLRASAIPRAKL